MRTEAFTYLEVTSSTEPNTLKRLQGGYDCQKLRLDVPIWHYAIYGGSGRLTFVCAMMHLVLGRAT
jgi:hypothetical protein